MFRFELPGRALLISLLVTAACGGEGESPAGPTPPDPPPPLAPNVEPIASFTADVEEGEAPVVVTFDAGASRDPDGTIVSYSWSFGDGANGVGTTVSHTYSGPGLFAVDLVVRDDRGGEDAARDSVFVSSPPGTGPNTVHGTVWLDRDLDGEQGPAEHGLHRFVVFLDEDADGTRGATEPMTFTAADGTYAFAGLDADTPVRVTQELTLGWTNTTPGITAGTSLQGGPARIIRGEEADIETFPFQVALLDGDFQFCGGTLINSFYVLTAAHCVDDRFPDQVDILIGTADLEGGGERLSVTAIRTHPDFSATLDYDVALLRLERPLLRPRAYLQTPDQVSLSEPGVIATVIGWGQLEDGGQPTRLRRVEIPIITNALCADIAGEIYGTIGPRTLCAGGRDLGKGPCFGDSGGPLLVPFKDGWTQIGIVSFGTARDACGEVPGAFSRVSELLDYIVAVAGIETSGSYVVDWSTGPSVQVDFGNLH